jgi:hypothetical protein
MKRAFEGQVPERGRFMVGRLAAGYRAQYCGKAGRSRSVGPIMWRRQQPASGFIGWPDPRYL